MAQLKNGTSIGGNIALHTGNISSLFQAIQDYSGDVTFKQKVTVNGALHAKGEITSENKILASSKGRTIGGSTITNGAIVIDGKLGIDENEIYSSNPLFLGSTGSSVTISLSGSEKLKAEASKINTTVPIFEQGTSLSAKYLGKTAKAADSDKLDGLHASSFARTSGTYSGLRAQATTKADVGLGSVPNWSSGTFDGRYLGKTANAVSASKWATARSHTVTLTGDVTGSATQSVDGTGNKSWILNTVVGDDSHVHHRLDSTDDRDVKPNTSGIGSGVQAIKAFFTSLGGMTGSANTDYQDLLVLDTYSDTSGGNANAITMDKSDGSMRIWNVGQNASSWGSAQRVFADNYHPNADKWTTARTITLNGDASGSVSIDGTANKTLTVAVANDSHTHDGRYYTESEANSRFVNASGDTMTGNLTIGNNRILGDLTTNFLDLGTTPELATVRSMEIRADDDDSSNSEYLLLSAGQNKLKVQSTAGAGTDNQKLTYNNNKVFHDAYHPNADKWTTARTITLNGDASGSVSIDGTANKTLTVSVANDSHTHDGRYYTEAESNARFLGKTAKAADSDKLDGKQGEDFVYNSTKHISKPLGGEFVTSTRTITGALKITLPVSWTNTMMMMTIKVYNYSNNRSATFRVGGYNYYGSNGTWINTFASMDDTENFPSLNVRFGHDGSKCAIYIGEVNTSWSYPQVFVSDIQLGYSGYTASTWRKNWSVGFVTSLGTITSTLRPKKTAKLEYNGDFKAVNLFENGTTLSSKYLGKTAKAVDSGKLNGFSLTDASTVNTVVKRNTSGDINARLFRSEYQNESSISGAIAYRINNSSNNYIRYCSDKGSIRSFLDVYSKGESNSKYVLKSGDNTGRLRSTGTGNDYNSGGIELLGNGVANTVFPTLGFHQGGRFASSIQLRGAADFRLYAQGSSSYADLRLRNAYHSGSSIYESRNNSAMGVYDSNKTDQIWSMGSSFRNDSTGGNFGNLYGLAYKHTNNTTGGTMAGGHQVLWVTNGDPKAAMGDSGVWTKGSYIHTSGNHVLKFSDTNKWIFATGSSYNWGLYWDTNVNQFSFRGAGIQRWWVDCDNGETSQAGSAHFSGGGNTRDVYIGNGAGASWFVNKMGIVNLDTNSSGSTAHALLRQKVNGVQKSVLEALNSGTLWRIRVNGSGNFDFNSGGSFTASGNITAYSDIRTKRDIKVIDNALTKIGKLKGVTFNRTDLALERQTGLIAQDLQKVLPEAVTESSTDDLKTFPDGKKLSVSYGNVVGLLVEGIKEERQKREELEKELQDLKAKLADNEAFRGFVLSKLDKLEKGE